MGSVISGGLFFYLAIVVLYIASGWKTFVKAGEPGWACLIPIYNFYIMAKISGQKYWWLMFIPLANIYIMFAVYFALAKSFGKDPLFGLGLMFLGFIFWPILGFGSAQYIGPNGVSDLKKDIDAIGSN